MDLINLLWVFLIIISLQPILLQKWIEKARITLIRKIEKKRNSRVILIVHRQETMSFLGFPVIKYLNMEDSEAVLRAIETTPEDKNIDLVLHTPGGLVLAALQIARAILNRKGKVSVIVPHYAMSGGTLIALAADEIIMSPHAVLGPIDPQLGQFPAASILNITQKKDINKIEDETLIMADMAEKALNQMKESAKEILKKHFNDEKAEELAKLLTSGKWTHDYPITSQMAKDLGLNVNTEIPRDFLNLMELYPQPLKHSRNVEYIPETFKKEEK